MEIAGVYACACALDVAHLEKKLAAAVILKIARKGIDKIGELLPGQRIDKRHKAQTMSNS